MRSIFLAFSAVLCYTTAMSYEPAQHGYSHKDLAAMSKLIDRETHPKAVRRHKAWTAEETRAALKGLGWEVAGK